MELLVLGQQDKAAARQAFAAPVLLASIAADQERSAELMIQSCQQVASSRELVIQSRRQIASSRELLARSAWRTWTRLAPGATAAAHDRVEDGALSASEDEGKRLRQLTERAGVVVAELEHRARNLGAVVCSLAQETMADSASMDEFHERFQDRLAALSRVQDLLWRPAEGEGGATFDALLRAELGALGALGVERDKQPPRVVLDGPSEVRLCPSAVQTLALALHELATNAVKHGALSQREGRLRVDWWVEQDGGEEARLHVNWAESGVTVAVPAETPVVADAPWRVGYGRKLIEWALPYQFGAETRYELGPDGVHCSIVLPASGLQTAML